MEELFNRQYSLTIGRASQLIRRTIPSTLVRPGGVESTLSPAGAGGTLPNGSYEDFLVIPNGAITVTDLRIKADLVDTKAGNTNKGVATIEIYNLSEVNQRLLRADDTVLLRAGYEIDGETPPLIYVGQVTSISSIDKGVDTITKIVCSSSEVARKNIVISKTPVRGETSRDVAEYFAGIAAMNGVPTGNVFVPVPLENPAGYPAAGNLFSVMEEFCARNALISYVTLGKLYIEPQDAIPNVAFFTIEEENVKSLKKEEDSAGKSSTSARQGVELVVFMDGRISTARTVRITFGEFRGDYDVVSANYKMDSEGSNWDVVVSLLRR